MIEKYALVNGFRLYGFNSPASLISKALEEKKILIALNAEKLYRGEATLQEISREGIGYADGIGAVLALKKSGHKEVVRIPGSELWLKIIEELSPQECIYLVGGTEEVVNAVVAKLKRAFPRIRIVGFRNGYLDEEQEDSLVHSICRLKPTVVFVAQGSPKQELLMKKLQKSHDAVYVGLGGSFDVFTGKVKRAPKIFRENGFEWLYRLLAQPTRVRRQAVLLPFLFNLLTNRYQS